MAVALKDLYADITPQYDVELHTVSCFGKKIGWIHMVEDADFIPLLHGDELVFNSGLNYTTETWLKNLIDLLNKAHAGGLILALRAGHTFSKEIIDYCNQIHFPLFSASWQTPFIDIMRRFSEILLKNEQRETNLTAAFKNAVYYPENEEMYRSHFERNGFFENMSYTVGILSCHAYDTENGNERLTMIEKSLRFIMNKRVLYEENGRLVILAAGYRQSKVRTEFRQICEDDPDIYVGIGVTVQRIRDIHISYESADTAYRLTKSVIPTNCLEYDELGVYKLLADVKNEAVYPIFVEETIGKLIEYDRKNETDYLHILETFFENECSILHTAEKLYCHKNTLNYKMNKIKEILGYDILKNENRVKIMLAFYIRRMEESGGRM